MGKMYVLLWHAGDRFIGVYESEESMMDRARVSVWPLTIDRKNNIILTTKCRLSGVPIFRYVVYGVIASASLTFQRQR